MKWRIWASFSGRTVRLIILIADIISTDVSTFNLPIRCTTFQNDSPNCINFLSLLLPPVRYPREMLIIGHDKGCQQTYCPNLVEAQFWSLHLGSADFESAGELHVQPISISQRHYDVTEKHQVVAFVAPRENLQKSMTTKTDRRPSTISGLSNFWSHN